MTKLIHLFPSYAGIEVTKIMPDPEAISYLTVKLWDAFEATLKNDPEVEDDDIEFLVISIPHWLNLPIIVDIFKTDDERRRYEQAILSKNSALKEYFDQNKLRRNTMNRISMCLKLYPKLFVSQQLQQRWDKLFKTIDPDIAENNLPLYDTLSVNQRIAYVHAMSKFVRKLCITYIRSREPKE